MINMHTGRPRYPGDVTVAAWMFWGQPDHCEKIADGLYNVDTPSHGGWVLSPDRLARVPAPWRDLVGYGAEVGAFEEDCAWSVPALIWLDEVKAWAARTGRPAERYEHYARATVLNWYPGLVGALVKPQGRQKAADVAREIFQHERGFHKQAAQRIVRLDIDGAENWEACFRDLPGSIAVI